MTIGVYVLTRCVRREQLYASTLLFKTLRDGFPAAEVFVTDNASLLSVRSTIRTAAREAGARFRQYERPISHAEHIAHCFATAGHETIAFVDPDICLWRNVEDWHFSGLIAGRLIPKHLCPMTGMIRHARLHTSFLWVPSVQRLKASLLALDRYGNQFDPLRPFSLLQEGQWHFYDTASALYLALEREAACFQQEHLDAYDHLFAGSSVHRLTDLPGVPSSLFDLHERVKCDHVALRGAWRPQEEYFQTCARRLQALNNQSADSA
jgi:hypothetical protein